MKKPSVKDALTATFDDALSRPEGLIIDFGSAANAKQAMRDFARVRCQLILQGKLRFEYVMLRVHERFLCIRDNKVLRRLRFEAVAARLAESVRNSP